MRLSKSIPDYEIDANNYICECLGVSEIEEASSDYDIFSEDEIEVLYALEDIAGKASALIDKKVYYSFYNVSTEDIEDNADLLSIIDTLSNYDFNCSKHLLTDAYLKKYVGV